MAGQNGSPGYQWLMAKMWEKPSKPAHRPPCSVALLSHRPAREKMRFRNGSVDSSLAVLRRVLGPETRGLKSVEPWKLSGLVGSSPQQMRIDRASLRG